MIYIFIYLNSKVLWLSDILILHSLSKKHFLFAVFENLEFSCHDFWNLFWMVLVIVGSTFHAFWYCELHLGYDIQENQQTTNFLFTQSLLLNWKLEFLHQRIVSKSDRVNTYQTAVSAKFLVQCFVNIVDTMWIWYFLIWNWWEINVFKGSF